MAVLQIQQVDNNHLPHMSLAAIYGLYWLGSPQTSSPQTPTRQYKIKTSKARVRLHNVQEW